MGSRNNINVCVVKSGELGITETFILAHAMRLPANVTLVHGNIPRIEDRPVKSQLLLNKAFRKGWRILRRYNWEWEITSAYILAFRRSRAAAVMAEYGITGVRVMEACKRVGIPLIVQFHGYDASNHEVLKEFSATYPILFQQAVAIITVSSAMKKKLILMGAPPEKIHYNPYGVDCQTFGAANPDNALPVFLSVGRFVDKKAPHLTLLAFSKVHRACPAARLRMIGDGPLLGSCTDLAEALGITHAVTFLRTQPHSVVQEEMRRALCFVQHSIEAASGDCEGTPVAILEAAASGLPVVSTRHAGIPDVVIEGETGFLVDEHDVKAMAVRMLQIVQYPKLAGEMGRAARRRVEAHFSMEQSIDRLWSVIESCIVSQTNGRIMKPPTAWI